MRFSLEVTNILSEAQEIAAGANQPFTTGHILLGMLTSTNRAAATMTDISVDAKRIVGSMSAVKREDRKLEESEALLSRVEARMLDAARRSDSNLVSSLHLLMALTREKSSIAYRIFSFMGIPPAHVRTLALGRITGPVPRSMARRNARRSESLFEGEPSQAVAVAVTPEPQPPAESKAKRAPKAKAKSKAKASDKTKTNKRADKAVENAADSDEVTDKEEAINPFELDPEDFPTLTSLGRNLTALAYEGKLDPVIGRATLIDAMIDVLNKRRSNNPCLVGEPGVGKTAVVEGLATAMLERVERVAQLRDQIIIEIDVGTLVAGTELRGSFSRRMAKLKDEVRAAEGSIIVFIDEIHTLVGAGGGDGPLDAANDLKSALARGEFPCIGATTPDEYYRHIERDPALERRFQPIEVDEPSEESTIAILQGLVERYEAHHGVIYRQEALEASVKLSRRYIVDRRLPDKALNVMDTAAARAVRRGKETVETRDVAEVISELASIPIERLMMSDAARILDIRNFMERKVIGHGDVLDRIADVIQRNSAGFNSTRPIGSFLFLGPTGVGKTETAKALADFLFCSKESLTRFDMSEYMEKHAISRLLGAAPGYVGHEEAGQLTVALKRRPYQVMLFDEIEKAHPDILYILLQILDEGRVTDSKGRQLNLSNTVVIMTSNLGSETTPGKVKKTIGFSKRTASFEHWDESDKERLADSARKDLPAELWGRIEEKCVFGPLGEDEVRAIARLLIVESSDRLHAERKISYTVDPSIIDHLIDNGGYEPTLGARPMRRAVQRVCETAIARGILRGKVIDGDKVALSADSGEVVVTTHTPAAPSDTPTVTVHEETSSEESAEEKPAELAQV
jgi:ATP-dependent Clp protease ATP-binding subunit ClpC